jgi:hypothetical protein
MLESLQLEWQRAAVALLVAVADYSPRAISRR